VKLAIVSDDGHTVSQHFGRAAYYVVVGIANGKETGRELRPRQTPHTGGHEHHHHQQYGPGPVRGTGPQAAARHAAMAAQIGDCQLLVAGGMGVGAVRAMEAAGIRVVLTDLATVDEVIAALASGGLRDRRERMH